MSDDTGVRTYGNWRQPRAAGFGKLSFSASLGLIATLVAVTITYFVYGPLAAVMVGGGAAIVLVAVTVKDRHGVSAFRRVGDRMRFERSRRLRANVARTGVLAPTSSSRLPGILGGSKLSEHVDAYDRRFAVIEHADGTLAVVLSVTPTGKRLVDQSVVDQQVALWGAWLGDLAGEIGIVAASVTIETAPDSGERLRREISNRTVETASAVARQVLEDIVVEYRVGDAQVRSWITIVFDPAQMGAKRRDRAQAVRDIASRLPGLTQTLLGTGAGGVHVMTALEVCRMVRVAYDPASEELFEEAATRGQDVEISWADVAPIAWEASWDSLRHDSGHSRTWTVSRPPRGVVQSGVLQNVLAPSRDVDRKRVTILYRPIDAAIAPDIVESDVNHAQARIDAATRPSARDITSLRQAQSVAAEEASGAGLLDFGAVITATSMGDDLADTSSAMESLAASSRLQIRTAFGAQDTAFVLALPLGVQPAAQAVSGGWA